jgi:photosystem II stability/assembly factor-like uncharacterized protein
VRTKIILTTLACSFLGLTSASSNEQSFIAPLVKESLLLGASIGQHNIIVGERGHILVNETPENSSLSSFSQVPSPTKVTLTNVFSIDNVAWAVGHDATIIKSSDAGLTWSVVQSDPDLDRPLLSVYFFDKDEGVAAGAYGLFYRSMDGGITWTQERHPGMLSDDDNEYLDSIKEDEAFYLEELSFISPHLNQFSYANNILYLAGEAGLVATSANRGRSWNRSAIDYQGSFFDVGILEGDSSLAVGLRGNMFVLHDNEPVLIPTCVTTSLNTVITTPTNVFVAGNNGVLLSIDMQNLNSTKLEASNSEGCQKHASVSLISTEFSDAILAGIASNEGLLLVTAGGLKTVSIEE